MNADWIKKMRENEKNFPNAPERGYLFENRLHPEGGLLENPEGMNAHKQATENSELKSKSNKEGLRGLFNSVTGPTSVNQINNNSTLVAPSQTRDVYFLMTGQYEKIHGGT